MQIGVSLRTAYAADGPTAVRWVLERAQVAHDVGLDHLSVGDHHATGFTYLQNTVIAARLAAVWRDRPLGALFLLPLWNPVLVAEQVGTLASVADGPFILQVALGGGRGQFDAMGVPLRGRTRAFEEGLARIRALLDGADPAVRIGPRPPAGYEVWVGAEAPPAIERAARLGDAWYAAPGLTYDEAARSIERYRAACERAGRNPGRIPLRRDVYVAADRTDADRVAGPVIAAGYRGFDPSALLVGTPEEVAAELERYRALGFTDCVARNLADHQPDALASTARLGEVRRLLAG